MDPLKLMAPNSSDSLRFLLVVVRSSGRSQPAVG